MKIRSAYKVLTAPRLLLTRGAEAQGSPCRAHPRLRCCCAVHYLQDLGRQEAHRDRAQGREGCLVRRLLLQAAGRRLPIRRPRRGDRHQVGRHRQQAHLPCLVRMARAEQGYRRGSGGGGAGTEEWGEGGAVGGEGAAGRRVVPTRRMSPPFAHSAAARCAGRTTTLRSSRRCCTPRRRTPSRRRSPASTMSTRRLSLPAG